jgi:S1-C subfamily serine protease
VTNAHVIEGELLDDLQVRFPSSEPQAPEASLVVELLHEDANRDLAILRIDDEARGPPLRLRKSYTFRRGEDVTVIGNPDISTEVRLENAVSRGVMSSKTSIGGQEFYQLSIAINPGNSGGPVVDSSGYAIGVVTLKAVEKEGIAFCIPAEDVRKALERAKTLGDEESRSIGSQHRAKVAFAYLSAMGDVYGQALDAYVQGIGQAIDSGGTPQSGLESVADIVDRKLSMMDVLSIDRLEATTKSVATDTHVREATREKLIELWSNFMEMRKYALLPQGTYITLRDKTAELKDNHLRLTESLRLTVGAEQ